MNSAIIHEIISKKNMSILTKEVNDSDGSSKYKKIGFLGTWNKPKNGFKDLQPNFVAYFEVFS